MRCSFLLLLLLGLLLGCKNKENATDNPNQEATLHIYQKFSDFAPRIEKNNDTTYVINFWATTCPPCIKEMPYFEELGNKYKNEDIKVLLVSLDAEKSIQKRVLPFLKKHSPKMEVVLLADQNYSVWTGNIDASWYGALPATLIRKNDKVDFYFGSFPSFKDLECKVIPFLIE